VCPDVIRRSVHECREALGPLVNRVEPKTPRDVHAVKAAERAGNARGTGARRFIQVAEVGQTHRAPYPPEDRKVLWWNKQGASRREARSTADAEHEPRNGETVRGIALTIKRTRWFGLWVSARRFSVRRKMFSGFCPSDLYGSGEAGSFGSQVKRCLVPPQGTARRTSASAGTEAGRACLRTTHGTSEGRDGSVKAPQGPRRSTRSSHPRR
jgi:hypothetical protein